MLKNKDSLILSDPEKKRNAIIEFNNFLTTQCFSLLENHYHKTLVLKLLFSPISKDINNRQNRTLLYARDLLNKAFSNQNDIQKEDLVKQRLLEIDKNNLDEIFKLDAEIVYNSFACAYNQLNLDTRNTIRAIYDDYSVKYENK